MQFINEIRGNTIVTTTSFKLSQSRDPLELMLKLELSNCSWSFLWMEFDELWHALRNPKLKCKRIFVCILKLNNLPAPAIGNNHVLRRALSVITKTLFGKASLSNDNLFSTHLWLVHHHHTHINILTCTDSFTCTVRVVIFNFGANQMICVAGETVLAAFLFSI